MEKVALQEITTWIGGRLPKRCGSTRIGSVSTDSRKLSAGELFVALIGEHFNGHDFLKQAAKKEASAAIVAYGTKANSNGALPLIRVRDTVRALQHIAAGYRRKFDIPVIAVTGSNGKTTTKEFIATLAGEKFNPVKTEGTQNNHIGVPFTLLKIDKKTRLAVVEMGMNHRGEIRRLTKIAAPTIGVITNINPSHLKSLQSIENVARAKRELLENMEGGIAVLNRDDRFFRFLSKSVPGDCISFGFDSNADVRAEEVRYLKSSTKFDLNVRPAGKTAEVKVPVMGRHNICNLLAAVAACYAAGVSPELIRRGIGKIKLPPMRFQISRFKKMTFINDAYNANPVSMKSSLETFSQLKAEGRKLFVCGDMLELGSYSSVAHSQVGRWVADYNLDYLITYGSLSQLTADAAVRNGMNRHRVRSVDDIQDVVQEINAIARPGDCILLKGSRGMAMEKILDIVKTHNHHKE